MSDAPANPNRTGAKAARAWRWLALAWLLVVLGIGVQQWNFWSHPRIDSDVLALLPQAAGERELSDATRRIADAGARQLVVLVGAESAGEAKRAAQAFDAKLDAMRAKDAQAVPFARVGDLRDWFAQAQAFFAPHRDRLLSDAQRESLRHASTGELAQQALAALYSPFGASPLGEWRSDPLGLWPVWWQQRAAASGVQADADGILQGEGKSWVLLQYETADSAFHLNGDTPVSDALDAAEDSAKHAVEGGAVPGVRVLRAGVPLHAEAAASRANVEINTIGWGSLAAVLLLVWLAFASLRPILLVALSLLVGTAAGMSATALAFGKVHLLTLVFGASLVGVAEDFGIHWFASRQSERARDRWDLMRHLLPGMALALATSALAYVALGLAPFPGLRQMALFSVAGLCAAFLTVVCWFPWLESGAPRDTRFARRIGASLQRWPRVQATRRWKIAGIAFALFTLAGLWRVQANDDLRGLQASPKTLIDQQIALGKLLGLPSPAQFFLVQGKDADEVLQREEILSARLQALEADDVIAGHRGLSEWIPSLQRQRDDAALSARLETAVLANVAAATGQRDLQRAAFAPEPLDLQAFLASPVSQPFRNLWLGGLGDGVAGIVQVNGLSTAALPAMQQAAQGLDGVRWVDRVAGFSALLHHYRVLMAWLLLAGTALVFGALWLRYRRNAWRAFLPTLIALAFALAMLGWLGQPLQLFNVLALLLLVGVGVDYGIFLIEHDGDASAWMAVCVGAASTWLSFGLLGLSHTPALRAFGLTLMFGLAAVWLLSPLFRPPGGGGAR